MKIEEEKSEMNENTEHEMTKTFAMDVNESFGQVNSITNFRERQKQKYISLK